MKHLLALILWLVALPAFAADPVASLVASRTSGVAPLCVHFDATGSTDADTTNPFRDLLYRWNFGNPNAGNWTYGANTSLSKNLGRGAVAGHCYESAGTYTVRLQVCDAAKCSSATQSITVTAPDTTYSGTGTVCIANVQATAGAGGCPSGASTPAGTSDFDAAISANCNASNVRCLFKKGDTFAVSTDAQITGTKTNIILGSYGTGAKPAITIAAPATTHMVFPSGSVVSNVVIDGLDFVGKNSGVGLGDDGCLGFNDATTNVTFIRSVCRLGAAGIGMVGNGDTARATGLFVVSSSFEIQKRNACYCAVINGGFYDNYVDSYGEHGIRIQFGRKTIVSNNRFARSGTWTGSKHQLTIRSAPRAYTGQVASSTYDTQYVYISDNYFGNEQPTGEPITIAPAGDTQCHWISDVIFERNFIDSDVASTNGIRIIASRVTVRNNIHMMAGTGDSLASVSNSNTGTCAGDTPVFADNFIPVPTDNWIGQNTIYRTGGAVNFIPIQFRGNLVTAVTYGTAYNNLVYSPSATNATIVYTVGTTTGTTSGTNSTSTQARTVNPFTGTPMTAITFRPPTTSYAASGGTNLFPAVAEDFYLCRDRTGAVRYGALVPAARAQCAGVAGAP